MAAHDFIPSPSKAQTCCHQSSPSPFTPPSSFIIITTHQRRKDKTPGYPFSPNTFSPIVKPSLSEGDEGRGGHHGGVKGTFPRGTLSAIEDVPVL